MKTKEFNVKDAYDKLLNIEAQEPEVAYAIGMVIEHIDGCYSDKYAKGIDMGIDTKKMLYNPDSGKKVNEYQIAKYLQRYVTEGTKKSGLLIDLMKIIHYSIFEIVRRIKCGKLDYNEPTL